MKHEHIIKEIAPGSIADELGLAPGDRLLAINDQEIEDVFDYHFFVNDEELTLLVEKQNGEQWELEIEKDIEEDLGIEFDKGLMDEYQVFQKVLEEQWPHWEEIISQGDRLLKRKF